MRISGLTIIIVGLAIGLSVLGFAFFQHWVPNRKETTLLVQQLDEHERVIRQMPAAIKRVQQAEALVAAKKVEWMQIVATRTPPATLAEGGIDLSVHRWQLVIDAPKFRDNIQRALNTQLKSGGVTVVQGPRIPDPSADPNAILAGFFNYPPMPYPVVVFDLGQVTIRGTYKQISDHIRAWSRMPRYLAVADRLQLQGTSPLLTANYNLTMVGFIRSRVLPPPVPQAGTAAGGVAGGVGGAPVRGGGRIGAG